MLLPSKNLLKVFLLNFVNDLMLHVISYIVSLDNTRSFNNNSITYTTDRITYSAVILFADQSSHRIYKTKIES
jgi:hypothetical protein